MSDEHYLVLVYFSAGAGCILVGLAAYFWLRRPLGQIVSDSRYPSLGAALKNFFPASTLLIAVAAFASVSYYSCGLKHYPEIVSDRAYIREMAREQISASFFWLVLLVVFWGIVILLFLLALRRRETSTNTADHEPQL